MSTSNLFGQTLLAESSYGMMLPQDGRPTVAQVKDALLEEGFSESQIAYLQKNYAVLHHRPNTPSGFSATLFEGLGSGIPKYTLAIRGTEQLFIDLIVTDLGGIVLEGAALNQIVDMYNYWMQLTAGQGETVRLARIASTLNPNSNGIFETVPVVAENAQHFLEYRRIEFFDQVGGGLGAIIGNVSNLSVTGHSLGGHLATAFERLFPSVVSQAYTVNGAGTRDSDLVSRFFDVLAESQETAFDSAKVTGIYGSAGPNIVSGELVYDQIGDRGEIFTEGVLDRFGHGNQQMTDSAAVFDLLIQIDGALNAMSTAVLTAELFDFFKAVSSLTRFRLESMVNLLGKVFVPEYASISMNYVDQREILYNNINSIRALLPQSGLTMESLINKGKDELSSIGLSEIGYRYALRELNPLVLLGSSIDYNGRLNVNDSLGVRNVVTDNGLTDAWIDARSRFLEQAILYNMADGNLGTNEIGGYYEDQHRDIKIGSPQGVLPRRVFARDDGASPVIGLNGDDFLFGGTGADTITANAGKDYIEGAGGADLIEAGAGNDEIHGGDGQDTIRGGSGVDLIVGGKGNDAELRGGDDADTIWGDEQQDSVRYAGANYGGADQIYGEGGIDNLYGGGGDDILLGGADSDYLDGGSGSDFLGGDEGADTLYALDDDGDDRLRGGPGFDFYYADFGDSVADTPEGNLSGRIYVGPDKVLLSGGSRQENESFFKSDDGRFIYSTDSLGAVYVRELGRAGAPLKIEAPTAPVPGLTDTGDTVTSGRPDLGITLATHYEDRPQAPEIGATSVISQLFKKASSWKPRKDPLALDLGAPGLAMLGDLEEGIVRFDHDGNGSRTGTGWLTGEDAWVVLDRDGDGQISIGAELFGVDTQLPNGTLAHNGYEAIAPLDTNLDRMVDAADTPLEEWQIRADVDGDGFIGIDEYRPASFADLQLWRDLNHNGFSEPNELSFLADEGIVALGTEMTPIGTDLPGGNRLIGSSSFTRADGSLGASGALDLARETFYRDFTSPPEYNPDVDGLPAAKGSGRVRDLQEAASSSGALRAALLAAAEADTRAAQWGAMDELLRQWADSSSMAGGTAAARQRPDQAMMIYSFQGIPNVSMLTAYETVTGGVPTEVTSLPEDWFRSQQSREYLDMVSRIEVLERFLGKTFVDIAKAQPGNVTLSWSPSSASSPGWNYSAKVISQQLMGSPLTFLNESYEILKETVYGPIAAQTRLKPYIDAAMDGSETRNFSAVESLLLDKRAADRGEALADLVELGRYVGVELIERGWLELPRLLESWSREALADPGLNELTQELRIGVRSDISQSGTFYGDIILGSGWLPGYVTPAQMEFRGQEGNDFLLGGSAFEHIYGGAGNDIISMGSGGKRVYGGGGHDLYLFGRSSGTVRSETYVWDPVLSEADMDVLQLMPGIRPEDVHLRRDTAGTPFPGGALAITIDGSDAKFIDAWFAVNDIGASRTLNEVRFADGTTWDYLTLRLKAIEGTTGDDDLGGYSDSDDVIDGISGNDWLAGMAGNDTLNGGAGDDTLIGGVGIDTYVLAADGGHDTLISENRAELDIVQVVPDVDATQIRLLNTTAGLWIWLADGTSILDTGNSRNPDYEGDGPGIARIDFADGSFWDSAGIRLRSLLGATDGNETIEGYKNSGDVIDGKGGNDSIYGMGGADTLLGGEGSDGLYGGDGDDALDGDDGSDQLYGGVGADALDGEDGNDLLDGGAQDDNLLGGEGDDQLLGGSGNDLLDGGNGDDLLSGGSGNDIYVFAPGGGRDIITEAFSLQDGNDVLRFADGVLLDDIYLDRDGLNVYFSIAGTGDSIQISRLDLGLDGVEFADGTLWGRADLLSDDVPQRVTEGDDILFGTSSEDSLNGLGGADRLYGFEGDDFLDGGAGSDQLYGGDGNDIYFVDNVSDVVFEYENEGDDAVYSSVNWAMGSASHVETLTLTGSEPLYAMGNNFSNVLLGNGSGNWLVGFEADDLLAGAQGDDLLEGGAGDDVYQYSLGDGFDEIRDSEGQNLLQLLDLVADDIEIWRKPADGTVFITIGDEEGRIDISGNGIDAFSVSGIEFSDGQFWDDSEIQNHTMVLTKILGTSYGDYLEGSDLDDQLFGFEGDDLLQGGQGNDLLDGGPGSDFYIFLPGDGVDRIHDEATTGRYDDADPDANDALYQAGYVNSVYMYVESLDADLQLGYRDELLIVKTGVDGDQIEISGFDRLDALGPHAIKYFFIENDDDGIALNYSSLLSRGMDLFGGDGADLILGTNIDDRFQPSGGNDLLVGEAGSDRYFLESGTGSDTIVEADNFDDIDVLVVSGPSEGLSIEVQDQFLVFSLADHPDSIRIDWFSNPSARIEEIQFGDGVVWDQAEIESHLPEHTNRPPVVGMPIADLTTEEDAAFHFAIKADTFQDPDHDTLSYVATLADGDPLPGWLTFDTDARSFDGTPRNADVGDLAITVFATDEGELSVSETFTLTIGNVNDAPLAAADQISVDEGGASGNLADVLLENDTDEDADDTLSIQAINTDGTIGTVEFDLESQTLQYSADVPAFDSLGEGATATDSFSYIVEDAAGAFANATVTLTIQGVNDAPFLATPIGNQEAASNHAFVFALPGDVFKDIDAGDTLTYSAMLEDGSELPDWLSFNAESRTFSGTPDNADLGTNSVIVIANDSLGESASDVFDILVVRGSIDGTAFDDVLTGTDDDDVINGFEGNDVLDGSLGADTMAGGPGDDTYVIESLQDLVIESAQEGTDLVQASVNYVLGPEVENLTLTGPNPLSGTGNALDNLLVGNPAKNILTGGTGNDTLDGGGGADAMSGGTGDDSYFVDTAGDAVTENANEGWDTVNSSITHTLKANIENLNLIGTLAINGTGNTLDNILRGNGAANVLSGGPGNDIYHVGLGDSATEAANAGNDTVVSEVTWTLAANFENLTLAGEENINATGNTLGNLLIGNSGNNLLNGGASTDTMVGGGGDDIYTLDNLADVIVEAAGGGIDTVNASVSHALASNLENLTLTGSAAINGTGNEADNVITGNAAANILDGGLGADMLAGGSGNDTYIVDNDGDSVAENLSAGTDTVKSSISYALPANVENLVLTGNGDIDATGNDLANVITGNAGINLLRGGLGNDSYVVENIADEVIENALEGTDTIQSSVDYTLSAYVENLMLTGSAGIAGTGNEMGNAITGNSGANLLSGDAGNDTLNGGAGADTLIGGTGNDVYVLDNALDLVLENASEGTDTIQSVITFALPAEVENITLTGTADIEGYGNDLNNVITGNVGSNLLTGGAGNDRLNGGLGADTLIGESGNDVYVVDNLGDIVIENPGEGTDTVQASISWTLGANIENLTLTGSANINATGNELGNTLTGNSGMNVLTGGGGNDILNGAVGADILLGEGGNDSYTVDNVEDVVVEDVGAGTDLINASVTYSLAANVENLTLTGSDATEAIGNELDNVLTGNAANNVLSAGAGNDSLNGGAGADTLIGGAGNDTYTVDNAGDLIVEIAGDGSDSVNASVSHVLAGNLESLVLTGTGSIDGTGNELDNVVSGNSGANILQGGFGNDILDGKGGADTLVGGPGNDTYFLDNAGDSVVEGVGEGIDLVNSTTTRTLAVNAEHLILTGTAAINGTGNADSNLIRGNIAGNFLNGDGGFDVLEGGAGNDTLSDAIGGNFFNGGAGNDRLTGSSSADFLVGGTGNDILNGTGGADVIAFNVGDGQDTINPGAGNDDTLSLGGASLDLAVLNLQKSGNNLIFNVSATDKLTFVNWYASAANKSVLNLQIVAEAMASFDAQSANPLFNQKVQNYNFQGLAGAFDAARAASPGITSWSLTNALTQFHLAGSDGEALGGDLAYYQGRDGSLPGVGLDKAQEVVSSAQFGVQAQGIQSLASLQEGLVRLT